MYFFEHIKKASAILLAWVAVGSLVCIFLGAFFISQKAKIEVLLNQHYTIIETNVLNKNDRLSIERLIQKNKIIPVSMIYENTLNYYNSIITILVFLIGVFGVVSWFSLKSRVRGDIEDCFRENMNDGSFKEILECKIKKQTEEYLGQHLPDYISESIEEKDIRGMISEEYELNTEKIIQEVIEREKKLPLKTNEQG